MVVRAVLFPGYHGIYELSEENIYFHLGSMLNKVLASMLEPGTQNVACIVGMAKAVELATQEMPDAAANLASLHNRLEEGILERIKHAHVNGHNFHNFHYF